MALPIDSGQLNDHLSLAGNWVAGLPDFFVEQPVSQVPVTNSAQDASTTVGDWFSNLGQSIGDFFGNLIGGITSPATDEINFILVAVLIAVVVLVLIIALKAGDLSKVFKIDAIF